MLYRSAPGPPLARLQRPTAATPTSLAVIADPHVAPWAAGSWKVFHRTERRLATAIADANRLDVDAVVFAGDLTKDGTRAAFDRVDDLLADLDVPFVAVPGDHDVPKSFDGHRSPPVGEFARSYAGGALPFVARVCGVDLVGIDTATTPDGRLADGHAGAVSTPQLDWLDSILPGLENPVVVCHHTLTNPAQHTDAVPDGDAYRLDDAGEVARVLSDGGVDLVVSGHFHWPATATLAGVREVIAPATCSLPQAFLHVEIGPSGTTVDLHPLADRAGFEEAYARARDGNARGRRIADRVDRGRLSSLPLVDDRTDVTTAHDGDLARPEH